MIPLLSNVATRIFAHWKSTVEAVAEAGVLSGAGALTDDPIAFKLALCVAAWRFLRGILAKDPE